MIQAAPAVTLSMRIAPDVLTRLEKLSDATHRTKSFLAAEAIENYLAIQAWQVEAIEAAVKKANTKGAKFVAHNDVQTWVNSWGGENEKRLPK